MHILKLALLAMPLLCAAAFAGQESEHKTVVKVMVADDENSEATTFEWTSDGEDARLDNMQVGEVRTVTDDAGRTAVVTREKDGYNFDIDGRSVKMPEFGEGGAHMMMLSTDGGNFEYDVEVTGDTHVVHKQMHGPEGVTIFSDEPLDDSVRESIRSVLQSAGRDDEITFIDGSGDGMDKRVRVIKKKVEIL